MSFRIVPAPRARILPGLACLLGLASLADAQTQNRDTRAATAAAASEEALQLSTFTVSGERDRGYESTQTTSGLRIVQELKNVANSISIINQQLMDDVGAMSIEDMTRWTVTGEANADPTQVNGSVRLVFRGITNAYAVRNGWIWYGPIDAYSTERVEIVRGPNSFLYGEADIGGFQNQITKRGLFNRDFTKAKLIGGSDSLRRVEFDANRRINRQVAVRVAAVDSVNDTWWHHGHRNYRGVYGAVTYKPFRDTTIYLSGEHSKDTQVRPTGFLIDQFSYYDATKANPLNSSDTSALTNASGVVYLPASRASYRLNGLRTTRGYGMSVIDPTLVPREYQFQGPASSAKINSQTVTLEIEQNIGPNLHLLLSSNYYKQYTENWGISAKNVLRDVNPTLPGGAPNPYYNELYTEYYRTWFKGGNVVKDIRLSAVYDLNTRWFKQQFVVNAQQHQDNPNYPFPSPMTLGEFVDPASSAFIGTLQTAQTRAAYLANVATLNNNRLVRRYYLKDGDGAAITGDMNPVAGQSVFMPNLPGGTSGQRHSRRFYTPSIGVGASGSYLNDHLFTLVGYRKDQFRMKTFNGIVDATPNNRLVYLIDDALSAPQYVLYEFHGVNAGGVVRINDMIAFSYNRANSFRTSVGDGADGYVLGTKQGVPEGKGDDIGVRLAFFGGRLQINGTRYNNFRENDRVASAPVAVRDEMVAIFPETFYHTGADTQKTTSSGVEVEMVANPVPNWRVMFNFASNKLVTEDRLPQLKSFQAQAKAQNRPTPETDAYLLTLPDGAPTAGYTKHRANVFTRYAFSTGGLKGLFVGGGVNWRDRTYRGAADLNRDGTTTNSNESLWTPSYYVVSALAGYSTRLFERPVSFQLNVDNVFDKDYYLSSGTGNGFWGNPRTFKLSATVEF